MHEIIKKYNIKAKKSLWQNFLMDENILSWIVGITTINNENILEVWPWFWALTQMLLNWSPKSLKLVELDTDMIDILNKRISSKDLDISKTDFEINNIDVLKYEPTFTKYKVIANIPYYITSPILFRFLYELKNNPLEMIILMQKEVWDRIVSKKSSVLSLFVQKKCTVFQEIFVPANCFSPPPKVDSTVLHFIYDDKYREVDDKLFLDFIKKAFSQPRKKLVKNLSIAWFDTSKINEFFNEKQLNPDSRPEDLWVQDFIDLYCKIF